MDFIQLGLKGTQSAGAHAHYLLSEKNKLKYECWYIFKTRGICFLFSFSFYLEKATAHRDQTIANLHVQPRRDKYSF